jgi:hypothetical protein
MLRGFPGGKAFLDSFGVKINASYISPLCFLNSIHIKLAIHFSLEEKIVKNYLHLSKLASQMVTSTPSENLSLHLYESQNKNFNFDTMKTLILHARSVVEKRNIFP